MECDAGGHVVGWNDAAREILGYGADEVLGRPCDEILGGTDVFGNRFCSPRCALRAMMASGQAIHDFVMIVRTAAGDRLTAGIGVRIVPGDDRSPRRIVHVFKSFRPAPSPHQPPETGRGPDSTPPS